VRNVRSILNKILWDRREAPDDYEVGFIHRGASGDVKTFRGGSLKKVERSWFLYDNGTEEHSIPLHRILTVRNVKTGDVLWMKRRRSNSAACSDVAESDSLT